MKLVKIIAAALLAGGAAGLQADDHADTAAKIKAAMASDIRSASETERDRNRRPMETLEFFGLRDDMTVVELLPGGGWYTKILVPVLAENGSYHAAIGAGRVQEAMSDVAGFEEMSVVAEDARIFREDGERLYSMEMDGLGVEDVDMVLTFRNYHNFSESGRRAMNEAAYAALKTGGIYGVVDHTMRHMEAPNDENRRRFDPVLAIKEIQEAGFRLVDYSRLHYRADDELEYEVGRRSVSGNTDRFTLKFVKE